MQVTLPAVMSADGRITKGDIGQAHLWSSSEDAAFFTGLIQSHQVLVMGRKTYEIIQPAPTEGTLRIVLTSKPESFADAAIPDMLEFINATPQKVLEMLAQRGYERILLVGGAPVHAAFLQAGLVDELYLTVEPVLFGAGLPLIDGALEVNLQLLGCKQLNDRGTLLLHYKIDK